MPVDKLLTITDVDACLMDEHYRYADAMEAVHQLNEKKYPLVLNSSKTLAELQSLAQQLQLDSPVVAENGGIVAVPGHSRLAPLCQNTLAGKNWQWHAPYWTSNTGISREHILEVARKLRSEQGYQFVGFADWGAEGIAEQTGLSPAQATMANDRHVSEPILWQDTQQRWDTFDTQLQSEGVRALRGGEFIHLMGSCDKSDGLREVLALYQSLEPETTWTTLALGDSPNDLPMIEAADIGVIVPHTEGPRIPTRSAHITYAHAPASQGWNQSVLNALANF